MYVYILQYHNIVQRHKITQNKTVETLEYNRTEYNKMKIFKHAIQKCAILIKERNQ